MSKPRKIGLKSTYIPNAKADMRRHKKVYQRGREKAFRCQPVKGGIANESCSNVSGEPNSSTGTT